MHHLFGAAPGGGKQLLVSIELPGRRNAKVRSPEPQVNTPAWVCVCVFVLLFVGLVVWWFVCLCECACACVRVFKQKRLAC